MALVNFFTRYAIVSMPEDKDSLARSFRYLQETVRRSGPAAAASYTLIGAIILLGGIGYAVDEWRGTSPWFLLGGLLLGLIVGFYDLAKTVFGKERRARGKRRVKPVLWLAAASVVSAACWARGSAEKCGSGCSRRSIVVSVHVGADRAVYRARPESLTSVMMAAFAGKLLFFGAYVGAAIAVLGVRPVPFAAASPRISSCST
jgi:F0F1-type ATP synthase assembly protein I